MDVKNSKITASCSNCCQKMPSPIGASYQTDSVDNLRRTSRIILIYTDSSNNGCKVSSAVLFKYIYLIMQLLLQLKQSQKHVLRFNDILKNVKKSVKLFLIQSHIGIRGNDKADALS